MSRRLLLLFILWPALLLPACLPGLTGRTGAGFQAPADRHLIAGVPFIPDDTSHCGPSTLAAVMTFQGRPTTREEVAADVQRTDLRGALGPDMVIWAREKGMKATFAASDPSQVMARLKEGQPLILLLETGLGPLRKGHFVVAVGYGPEGLVVNSGLIQQEIMPWADFLKSWRKMGNFTIFVSPGAPAGAPEEADSLGEAEAAPGEGEDEAEAREVVSPARVAQKLNLPVGLELPEELVEAPMGPKEPVIPARQIQSAPGYLIGVDLPDAKTRPETPIIDITEYPLEKAEETTRAASEAAGPEPGAEAGGAKGPAEEAVPGKSRMVVVMEPLPPGDVQKGDPGFSQRDLGPPLVLPVVPLPEEQPITGQLMGSDAVAPATVPGARRPGKKAEEAPSGPAEDAPATPPAGTALESPVMGWER